MISISDISIKYKLVIMQVFTSVFILALCSVAFIITDVNIHKSRITESIEAIAQVVGYNNISSIQFFDDVAAKRSLEELSIIPDVINAAILDQEGDVFATYTRPGADFHDFSLPNKNERKSGIIGPYLFVYNSITRDNMEIGMVGIQVRLTQLEKVKQEKYKIAGITLVVGLVLAFFIAMFVQRNISGPILELVGVMQKVKDRGDYTVRVDVYGEDEINKLSMVFNNMLEKIEERERNIKERSAELEAANQELESFSYSVSHDLRAPIRAINGFSSILAQEYQEKLDEEGKDLLNTITGEAKRMGQLIDDLLTFSRLGRKETEKTMINMDAMAKDAASEVLKLNLGKLKGKVTVKDLLPVSGDPTLIRQVWINLITNALKFSQQSPEPLVQIGSYEEDGYVVYHVKDNGVGFDMEYYDKLFGVFQRLHGKEEFEGTGIGLAIVKRTITRHGGEVWAEGKLNEGAVFYFSLPT